MSEMSLALLICFFSMALGCGSGSDSGKEPGGIPVVLDGATVSSGKRLNCSFNSMSFWAPARHSAFPRPITSFKLVQLKDVSLRGKVYEHMEQKNRAQRAQHSPMAE